jgi:hypothetical protein
VRQQLVFGAIWPATAGSMMRHHMNPVASILPPYGGGLGFSAGAPDRCRSAART